MANTLFNLQDPRTLSKIQNHIQALASRTTDTIEALHYVKTGAVYHCLDVDLVASSKSDLDKAVLEKLVRTPDGEILPAACLEDWQKALNGNLVNQRKLKSNATRSHWLVVSLCEVEP